MFVTPFLLQRRFVYSGSEVQRRRPKPAYSIATLDMIDRRCRLVEPNREILRDSAPEAGMFVELIGLAWL